MLDGVRPDRVLRVSSFVVLVAIAASGWLAAIAGIDLLNHLDWAPRCAIRTWTGFDCPGCGMTRALVLLGQFQFAACCSANPAAPGLVIVLGVGVVRPGLLMGRYRDVVAWAALVLVVIAWLMRNVP